MYMYMYMYMYVYVIGKVGKKYGLGFWIRVPLPVDISDS